MSDGSNRSSRPKKKPKSAKKKKKGWNGNITEIKKVCSGGFALSNRIKVKAKMKAITALKSRSLCLIFPSTPLLMSSLSGDRGR